MKFSLAYAVPALAVLDGVAADHAHTLLVIAGVTRTDQQRKPMTSVPQQKCTSQSLQVGRLAAYPLIRRHRIFCSPNQVGVHARPPPSGTAMPVSRRNRKKTRCSRPI